MESRNSVLNSNILSSGVAHHNQYLADTLRVIGAYLRHHNAFLSVAESCTGGLISHWLTNVPGSSDYFLFGAVTYSNKAKIATLGVAPETLEKFGAVHIQTAKEMARGVKRMSGATYGLSTTGVAGPGGGTRKKPVGTVCIGLAGPDEAYAVQHRFKGNDRLSNKQAFATAALQMLKDHLDRIYPEAA